MYFYIVGVVSLILLGFVILLFELGRRIAIKQAQGDFEKIRVGIGAVEGAVFGLLGLLLAFTFSEAASRFESRQQLVVQEANCIGTAWYRIDLLPADDADPTRQMFREYLDARLDVYRDVADP